MKIGVGLVSAMLCFSLSALSHAAPVITNVQGHLTDNTRLIITGSGFGSGPRVELFDPFEGGPAGSNIPLSSPRSGFWSSASGSPPIYDTEALSGRFGFRVFDSNLNRARQLTKVFSTPTTEVFVSYWVRIPAGTFFPGARAAAVFPLLPTWGLALIADGPDGFQGNDDLALPLFAGFNEFRLAGTDFDPGFGLGSNWWSFTEWMRLSFWLRADPARPSTANGLTTFQSLSPSKGIFSLTNIGIPLFDGDDNVVDDAIFQWTQISIPGFISDTIAGENVRPVMDDIYIASGPNAQARVEIGNNILFYNSTNFSIATPVQWSDNEIIATLNQGSFDSGASVFVHVVDANGNPSSVGFPLTAASATGDEPVDEGGCFISTIRFRY